MEGALAILIGGLFAGGFYLILRRSIFKLALGVMLLSHAVNLLVFSAPGLSRDRAPLVDDAVIARAEPVADPLPQALILTAIVINFAMVALALVLVHRTHRVSGTDDVDALTRADR